MVGRELTLATLGLGFPHEASYGPIHPKRTGVRHYLALVGEDDYLERAIRKTKPVGRRAELDDATERSLKMRRIGRGLSLSITHPEAVEIDYRAVCWSGGGGINLDELGGRPIPGRASETERHVAAAYRVFARLRALLEPSQCAGTVVPPASACKAWLRVSEGALWNMYRMG